MLTSLHTQEFETFEHTRRIRPCTVIYDRIRQPDISVYGAAEFIFEYLRIFGRSPYTESVSGRFSSYMLSVYKIRVRSPYISVFSRKRSFTAVALRPGLRDRIKISSLI